MQFWLSFSGLACAGMPPADREAAAQGQAVSSRCTACHGADGRASNRAWPNLAGLSKDYLAKALKDYRGGARDNGMMAGIVKDLSDADAESVASYFAGAACR